MSGGHFDYKQDEILEIFEEVTDIITTNDNGYKFSSKTIAEFKMGRKVLMEAYIYAQRFDWLLCGDDGEESFIERLNDDLMEAK